jgi:hypothetical protein
VPRSGRSGGAGRNFDAEQRCADVTEAFPSRASTSTAPPLRQVG